MSLLTNTVYVREPEDDEKKASAHVSSLRLKLFFQGGPNIDWTGSPNSAIQTVTEPEFTPMFQDVVDSKGETTRSQKLVSLITTAFRDKDCHDLFASAKTSISAARNLRYIARKTCAQILLGNFETERCVSHFQETTNVDLLSFASHRSSANEISLLRQQELIQDAEVRNNVPECQRSATSSTIKKAGSLANSSDVYTLAANVIDLGNTLIKPAVRLDFKPIP